MGSSLTSSDATYRRRSVYSQHPFFAVSLAVFSRILPLFHPRSPPQRISPEFRSQKSDWTKRHGMRKSESLPSMSIIVCGHFVSTDAVWDTTGTNQHDFGFESLQSKLDTLRSCMSQYCQKWYCIRLIPSHRPAITLLMFGATLDQKALRLGYHRLIALWKAEKRRNV